MSVKHTLIAFEAASVEIIENTKKVVDNNTQDAIINM